GVDDEIRRVAQAVHLVDGLAERAGHIGVGAPGEADVAVADLSEAQCRPGCLRAGWGGSGNVGDHLTTHHGQHNRRAEPSAVADQLTTAHRLWVALVSHAVTTTVPVMNG